MVLMLIPGIGTAGALTIIAAAGLTWPISSTIAAAHPLATFLIAALVF